MRKMFFVLAALLISIAANAQFEKGKFYGGASLSNLNLNYSDAGKLRLDVNALGGYFFEDNAMAYVSAGIDTNHDYTDLSVTIGGRYYIVQNGIYLGANVGVKQVDSQRHNDFKAGIEIGYAFFINRYITIEPQIFYDQSFKSHKDYSKVGFRLGLGFYL